MKKIKFNYHMIQQSVIDINPEKNIIWKDTCTPMSIVVLFTIARTWKQPKCPSTEKWIKKTWNIYTMEYYLAFKKEQNYAIYSNMDEPRNYYTEWSKKKTNIMILLICGLYKKVRQWTYLQNWIELHIYKINL